VNSSTLGSEENARLRNLMVPRGAQLFASAIEKFPASISFVLYACTAILSGVMVHSHSMVFIYRKCFSNGRTELFMGRLSRVFTISVLLVAAHLATPTLAQGQSDCTDATTTASMQTCALARYQTAQQELADVISQLHKKLDSIGRRRLDDAQVAWTRFRDANADYLADVARGGTLAPVLREIALADMTEARSKELKKTLRP
jgi:uncharacterized protein YecT (DUF1311 family)